MQQTREIFIPYEIPNWSYRHPNWIENIDIHRYIISAFRYIQNLGIYWILLLEWSESQIPNNDKKIHFLSCIYIYTYISGKNGWWHHGAPGLCTKNNRVFSQTLPLGFLHKPCHDLWSIMFEKTDHEGNSIAKICLTSIIHFKWLSRVYAFLLMVVEY